MVAIAAADRRWRKGDLALVKKMPAMGTALEVRVISVVGDCAWGYHEVDRWTIDSEGWSTPNLCQAAAAAVSEASERSWSYAGEERAVACRCPAMERRRAGCGCPMEDRRVTFGVRPARR